MSPWFQHRCLCSLAHFAALFVAAVQLSPLQAQPAGAAEPLGNPSPHWQLQYFHDELDRHFHITDLAFPSAERGIAVGVIVDDGSNRIRDAKAVVTVDGGNTWDPVELDDNPISLFFLDDSLGWMVTERGIWKTLESGRSWRRISRHGRGQIRRVWFLTEQNGFAVGEDSRALQTVDGGENWSPVTATVSTNADASSNNSVLFSQLAFSRDRGMMLGSTEPITRDELDGVPVWLFPEIYELQRTPKSLIREFHTRDGGISWVRTSAELYGSPRAVGLDGDEALILMMVPAADDSPSQLHHINLASREGKRVFAEPDRVLSDLLLFPRKAGSARSYIVGVEPPGEVPTLPVPGRVVVFTSTDLQDWNQMEVDYRAIAESVVLAGPDPEHVWIGTDSGMILRLIGE